MKTIKNLIFPFLLGVFVCCEDILEVPDISEQQVTLLAPTSGSVLKANTVGFNWETVEEATGYSIQVATPNFGNAVQLVLDNIVVLDTLGHVSTRLEIELPNGAYEWRVRAFNSDFETPTSTNAFQVDGEDGLDQLPPNRPQLVAPANGASLSEGTVNFSWTREDIPGSVERDSIFIFSDESMETLVSKALGTEKAHSTTLAGGIYYWFVRAHDEIGNQSDSSDIFSLTIEN